MRRRAAVIGAGLIGSRLDQGRPAGALPLTHAGGYAADPRFQLAGIAEADPDRRAAAAAAWGCPVFACIEELLAAVRPEVVSLCLPAAAQAALLPRLLGTSVRAVVAEKPLAPSVAEARTLVEAFEAAGIPLLVNYTRRYTPLFRELRQRYRQTGPALSATLRYARGLRHNGSHALDLIRFLFGPPEHWRALAAKTDAWPDDPTVSAYLSCPLCPEIFLIGLDERCFTHFEVDIIDPTARFQIDQEHRRLRRSTVVTDTGIPPGRRLLEVETSDSGYDLAMPALMADLTRVLETAQPPLCSGREALETLILASAIAGRLPT